MRYYSTGGKAPLTGLREAVIRGLAEDRGLYMPERIPRLPDGFFETIGTRSFPDIACRVADAFFAEDIPAGDLHGIVRETLSFDCPLREVEPGIFALELFHGPTLAFKDVGARFMARMLRHFTRADAELRATQRLTSANSINVARFLPQAFYYFHAYAQLQRKGLADKVVCCVPSGNFGNLCAALFGKRMGLPVHRFIAANNANRVFYDFLQDGEYRPRASVQTLANAMDVGDPSNFARIWDLYGHDLRALRAEVSGATYTDGQIAETIRDCYARTGYVLDPHGACGYRALKEGLRPGETGFFCETAHPAKFKDSVERILGAPVAVPERLAAFMQGTRRAVPLGKDYESFRQYLLSV